MNKLRLFHSVSFLLTLFFSHLGLAFTFSPSVVQFTPSGRDATQTYTVTNTRGELIAVRVSAATRSISVDGQESMTATDDFTIFPRQMSLKPGESRSVKVSYKGPANLTVEKAYRIIAEQVPVDLNKKPTGSGVTFQLKYETSAYITPSGTFAKVAVENMKLDRAKSMIEFEVVNTGTSHLTAREWELVLHFDDKKADNVTIKKESAGQMPGFNVLPGGRRRISIAAPRSLQKTPVAATLNVLLQ